MPQKLTFLLRRLTRQTWWRCALFSLFALAAVGISVLLGPYIPDDVAVDLGADSLEGVLNILAASMLTVAIFSASTMVSAFASVGGSATPRASQLLIEDATIQNSLATFIGAFLYSVIALIGVNAHIYGDGGRLVLFVSTLGILVLVVVVLLRWIDYLTGLGRMGETIRRVEQATQLAMTQRLENPHLGAQAQPRDMATEPHRIHAKHVGHVQHVAMDVLQATAQRLGSRLHLHVLPGTFVEPSVVLVSCTQPLDDDARRAVQGAITVGAGRTFDHDPRFGLVVLAEIAARALSPGINDPGTAQAVMVAGVNTLVYWARVQQQQTAQRQPTDAPVQYPQVTAPALREAGLVEDLFAPIARYGAGAVEVGVALQAALGSVQRSGHTVLGEAAQAMSAYALAHAKHTQVMDADLHTLQAAAHRLNSAAATP